MPGGQDIVLVLRVDDKGTRVIQQFSTKGTQAFKTLDKSVKKSGRNLDAISKKLKKAGRGLTVGLTLPLVGIGVAALKMSMDFNKSMANIGTLIPGNIKRVKELKTDINEMSMAFGTSAKDIADGAYQVISAFGDTAETSKILEINVKAAAAGMATTTDAINLTSAVTKGYNDTTAEAIQKAADLAFITVKLGQTTFPELAKSIGRVVPISAKLNVKQEEMFAIFATLTGVTGGAAEVSTQFAGILRGMMKPTDTMTELIGKLGFATSAAMVKELGLVGAMKALEGKTDGTAESVAKLLPRAEALIGWFALTGSQADIFAKKLGAMEERLGALDKAFKEIEKGVWETGFSFQQLKSMGAVLMRTLGDALAPALGKLIVALKPVLLNVIKLIEKFADAPGPIKAVVIGLGAFLAILGPALMMSAKVLWAVGQFKKFQVASKFVTFLTKAVKGLKAASAVTTVGLGILVGALLLTLHWTKKVRDAQNEVIESEKRVNEQAQTQAVRWSLVAKEAGLTTREMMAMTRAYKGNYSQMFRALKQGKESVELQEAYIRTIKILKGELKEMAPEVQQAMEAQLKLYKEGKYKVDAMIESIQFYIKEYEKAERVVPKFLTDILTKLKAERKVIADTARALREKEEAWKAMVKGYTTAIPTVEGVQTQFNALQEVLKKVEEKGGNVDEVILLLNDKIVELYEAAKLAKKVFGDEMPEGLLKMYETSLKSTEGMNLLRERVNKTTEAVVAAVEKIDEMANTYGDWNKKLFRGFDESFEAMARGTADVLYEIDKSVADVYDKGSARNALDRALEADARRWEMVRRRIADEIKSYTDMYKKKKETIEEYYADELRRFNLATAIRMNELDVIIEIERMKREAQKATTIEELNEIQSGARKRMTEVRKSGVTEIASHKKVAEAALEVYKEKYINPRVSELEGMYPKIEQAEADSRRKVSNEFWGLSMDWQAVTDDITNYWTKGIAEMIAGTTTFGDLIENSFNILSAGVGSTIGNLAKSALKSFGAIAGPIGGIVGGIVSSALSGLGKLFGIKSKAQKEKEAAEKAEKEWQSTIDSTVSSLRTYGKVSRSLAEEIATLAKDIGTTAAKAKLFSKIIDDVGISQRNINELWQGALTTLGAYRRGQISATDAARGLGESFTKLVEGARLFGEEGSKAMIKFIKKVQKSGVEVKEVTDYINAQLGIVEETGGGAAQGLKAMADAITVGMGDARFQLERVEKQTLATFNAMIKSGATYAEAMTALGPALETIAEKHTEMGQTGGAAISQLLRMKDIVTANEDLFSAVTGNLDVLNALANVGALNQEVLTDAAQQAGSYFEQLKTAGLSGNEALMQMAPTLQRLAYLAREHGLELDKPTQALLDQAEAAGVLSAEEATWQEKLISGLDRIARGLERLGGGFDNFGRRGKRGVRDVGKEFGPHSLTGVMAKTQAQAEKTFGAIEEGASMAQSMLEKIEAPELAIPKEEMAKALAEAKDLTIPVGIATPEGEMAKAFGETRIKAMIEAMTARRPATPAPAPGVPATVPTEVGAMVRRPEGAERAPEAAQPQIIFAPQLSAVDAEGMEELVTNEVFPKFISILETNKGGKRTEMRQSIRVD